MTFKAIKHNPTYHNSLVPLLRPLKKPFNIINQIPSQFISAPLSTFKKTFQYNQSNSYFDVINVILRKIHVKNEKNTETPALPP